MPCGFCGRDGCSISLVVNGKKTEMRSNCPFHYDFNYGAAVKYSAHSPSTNVPIHCPLCPVAVSTGLPTTFWKYNIDDHIHNVHRDADGHPIELPAGMNLKKHISLKEADRLGIAKETVTARRRDIEIPNTSDISDGEQNTSTARAQKPKSSRKRAATATSIGAAAQRPSTKKMK